MSPQIVWFVINIAFLALLIFGVFKVIDWARKTRKAAEEARATAQEALAAAKER